jgi:hypothetical protein
VNGVLAWLGVILLAWTAACAVMWALWLRAERARCQARDEAAADAIARLGVDYAIERILTEGDRRD